MSSSCTASMENLCERGQTKCKARFVCHIGNPDGCYRSVSDLSAIKKIYGRLRSHIETRDYTLRHV